MKRFIICLCLLFLPLANEFAVIIDSVTIDLKNFDENYQNTLNDYREIILFNDEQKINTQDIINLKYTLLDILIDNTIILKYAASNNISVSKKEVGLKIQEMKSRFPSDKDFWEAIKLQKSNYKKLANNIKDQLLKEKLVFALYPEYGKITSEDILMYLRRNKLLVVPIQYSLSLLVCSNINYLEELKLSENADELWDNLAINQLYSQQSIVFSDKQLEDKGYIDIISSLDLKSYSKIINFDENNYVTIRLNKIINSPIFNLESASELIRDSLIEERKSQLLKDWLIDQREIIPIVYNQKIFPNRSLSDDLYKEKILQEESSEKEYTENI